MDESKFVSSNQALEEIMGDLVSTVQGNYDAVKNKYKDNLGLQEQAIEKYVRWSLTEKTTNPPIPKAEYIILLGITGFTEDEVLQFVLSNPV